MYDEIVNFAIDTGKVSAPLIQRRFRFGYNRALRIIDLLEARGIIGPQNGSKPREVLYKKAEDDEKETEKKQEVYDNLDFNESESRVNFPIAEIIKLILIILLAIVIISIIF